MADDDKLINVVVKYSQQNADEVAKGSSQLSEQEVANWKKATNEAVAAAEVQSKNWIAAQDKIQRASAETATKEAARIAKMRTDFEKLTEDQLKAWDKQKPAHGVIDDPSSSPLNPAVPQKYNSELVQTQKHVQDLRQSMQALGQASQITLVAGAAIVGPAMLQAQNYVNTVGRITDTTSEWLGYQEDIKKATLDIGSVTAQALLPSMKSSAEYMEKVAQVLKDNPWMVQAAMYVGGTLSAMGMIGSIITKIGGVMAQMSLMMAKLEAAKIEEAANKALNAAGGFGGGEYLPGGAGSLAGSQAGALGAIGTVTLMAGSVILGAEIGSLIGNAIAKLIYGEDYKKQTVGDALITAVKMNEIALLSFAQLIGRVNPALQDFANKIIQKVNEFNELIGASETSSEKSQSMITEQEVQAFVAYEKALNEAQENYSQQRAEIVKQYEAQIVEVTQQYEQARSDLISQYSDQRKNIESGYQRQQYALKQQFEEAQVQSLADYQEQVKKLTEQSFTQSKEAQQNFQVAAQRAAQAHALEMERLEAQHNVKVADLGAARDALGLVKENQAYALEKAQREQDFNIRQNQQADDFRRQQALARTHLQQQLSDLKSNYDKQQAAQQEAYDKQRMANQANKELQMAELAKNEKDQLLRMDEAHKKQLKKMDEQEAERLKKYDEAYRKQIDQMQTNFIDRLRALDDSLLGDKEAFLTRLKQQSAEFQAWLDAAKSQQTPGEIFHNVVVDGKQNGGYETWKGPGETGRPEFVLSGASTKMAEDLMGSRLTQSNMLASLMAGKQGSSGGRSLQITVQSSSLTIKEIKNEIDTALNQKLGDLLPAFGGA